MQYLLDDFWNFQKTTKNRPTMDPQTPYLSPNTSKNKRKYKNISESGHHRTQNNKICVFLMLGFPPPKTLSFPGFFYRISPNTFWNILESPLFSQIQKHKQMQMNQKYLWESMDRVSIMFDPGGILVFGPTQSFESSGFPRNHKPHWGNRRKVTGEPQARATLTDLSSWLLEPQGKPGWGIKIISLMKSWLNLIDCLIGLQKSCII